MKLARILLASAAAAVLAACNSDPIGPVGGTPASIKPRHDIIATDSTFVTSDNMGDGSLTDSICVDTVVVVSGVATIVRVCDGRGPQMGTGQ